MRTAAGGGAREPDQVVDRDRGRPEQREHAGRNLIAVGMIEQPGGLGRGTRRVRQSTEDRRKHVDDVGGLGHQRCPLFDEAVGAFGARVER